MKFYQEFLGFWYTDDIAGIANFFTCNRDHHVVNIVNAPESRVHHIAFELRGTAHHTAAADTLRKAGFNQLWGPSRHTAGHNIAGYHYDPNQVMVEFYTEMDVFIPELGIQEPRPWHEHKPDEAQELAVPRTERVGRRVQLQPRRRLTAVRSASPNDPIARTAVRSPSAPIRTCNFFR